MLDGWHYLPSLIGLSVMIVIAIGYQHVSNIQPCGLHDMACGNGNAFFRGLITLGILGFGSVLLTRILTRI